MNTALQRLVEAVLGLHVDGQPSVSGRVLDPIGKPVEDAVVSARQLTGEPLIDRRVGAGGRFLLVSNAAWPDEYQLVVEARGVELRLLRSRPPPVVALAPPVADDVGDLTIRAPIVLTGSVGDGGGNARIDLRRVQERLHDLGRLTDADIQAEPLIPDPPPEALNIEDFPRLLAAVFAHNQAWLGHRQGVIRPGSASLRALNADPAFPITRIAVTRPVGSLPGIAPPVAMNTPTDVAAVQDRLHQLGLLTEGRYLVERVDLATAADPVATVLTSTVEAIARFEREVVGGELKAVPPGSITEQVLSDPYLWGRLPLRLGAPVGTGAPNRPADVHAVQERLHDLGALDDAAYGTERVAVPGPGDPAGPVPEADLQGTLNAIRAFRQSPQRLGEPAAPARVDLDDPAVARLDSPPRVDFHELHENATAAEPNRADDTRAIQDRLLLLGFLSGADHQAERVNPARPTGVPASEVPRTMAGARELLVSLGMAPRRPRDRSSSGRSTARPGSSPSPIPSAPGSQTGPPTSALSRTGCASSASSRRPTTNANTSIRPRRLPRRTRTYPARLPP